uniref:lysozyme n=1 Tax=Heterorhabditis bacteriophora TaxID=37862 RepID=A0A1I7XSE7_HETBA
MYIGIASALLGLVSLTDSLLMFDRVESENACLLAMCDADSGCVPKGCSIDQFDRIGCGYFRLNIYQFRQCYQPGKKEDEDEDIAWINCAEDYECSAQCIRTLGSRFRVKCYGKSDCETLARIHDGGANGCRERLEKKYVRTIVIIPNESLMFGDFRNTAFYWKRVRNICEGNCNKPIFVRH